MLVIFAVFFWGIAGLLAYLYIKESMPYIQADRTSKRVEEIAYTAREEQAAETEDPRFIRDDINGTPLGVKIDFDGLKEMNEDIIGWITIPGTQVSYAILQDKEQEEYYLHHTVTKEENILGSIFTYPQFSPSLTDPNTIIFGHNMRSGQMFGELSNYTDQAFYNEYPDVYIYTPERSVHCLIYSAYTCPKEDSTYTMGFEPDSAEFGEYILHTIEMSGIETGITPTQEDQVFILSTCSDTGDHSVRYVVCCVVKDIASEGREEDNGLESVRFGTGPLEQKTEEETETETETESKEHIINIEM